jgi:hypothetical protein
MNTDILDNPQITSIKVLAIVYCTIIFSIGGVLLSILADRYLIYPLYDKTEEDIKNKSDIRHIIETTLILGLFGALAYFGRNILQKIPFPLEGLYGFQYSKVKEVSSGALVLWILINYSAVLTSKIKIIRRILDF